MGLNLGGSGCWRKWSAVDEEGFALDGSVGSEVEGGDLVGVESQ